MGKKTSRTPSHDCTITYIRNPKCFAITSESQKIGRDLVIDFSWKKKDIFSAAEQILADRYFKGNIKRATEACKIISLTKHCYPKVIVYPASGV